ncbi:hypothetical protein K525DRAFT_255660, partial [Schizophyllum commune Loenen D]
MRRHPPSDQPNALQATRYALQTAAAEGSAFACPPPWLFSRIRASHKLPDPIRPHTNLPRRDTSSDRLLHVHLPLHVQFLLLPKIHSHRLSHSPLDLAASLLPLPVH